MYVARFRRGMRSMLTELVDNAELLFLIAVRVLAMVETAPLLSGDGVPQVVKVSLAGLAAAAVMPWVRDAGYPVPQESLAYVGAIAGEAMIGIITGFFLTVVYSAFSTAGQFFSLQMGFSASETYDPLAQTEIPVVGQFLNLIAMFVFVNVSGFQRLFVLGVTNSFKSIRVADLLSNMDDWYIYVAGSVGSLFLNALTLAFPIFGTLLLVSVTMGLLAKTAPQMNLLTESFPISILMAFLVMMLSMPYMIEAFSRLVDGGFESVALLLGGRS